MHTWKSLVQGRATGLAYDTLIVGAGFAGSVDGQLLPMPINLDTVNGLYGLNLSALEMEGFLASVAEKVERPASFEDVVVGRVGRTCTTASFAATRACSRPCWTTRAST
jgi:UDP-galactopyranose mutase